MLSIGAMGKAGADVAAYYEQLAREDYYTHGGEPPGQWRGAGATELGLVGQIDKGTLKPLLAGFDPHTDAALVQNAGPKHLAGWDLTFSAPKSVSVLWSQANPSARQIIQAAQQAAVDRTLQFIETHAAYTRRGHGSKIQEPVEGIVVATFEHSTSRQQDPQMHTHCLIANTAPRIDGTWGSLDSRHLYRWKMAAGAIYRAELAEQLQQRLQLGISQDGHSFRVHGIPKAVEKHFSKRAEQIQEHMHQRGLTSAKAAAVAALDSREQKDSIDRPALFQSWQQEGVVLGFGPTEAHDFLTVPPLPNNPIQAPEPKMLLETLTETASTFTEQAIWRSVAEANQGVTGYTGVQSQVEQIMQHDELVWLGRDKKGMQRYSTRSLLALEHEMVTAAVKRRGENLHPVSTSVLTSVLSKQTLSAEQIVAVKHLTQGIDGVSCVVGMAGTGKSYLLAAAKQIWQQSGYQVQGAALSGKATLGLEKDAQIPSQTLHRLLQQLDNDEIKLTAKDIVVIDEAGMIGSRMMHRLLGHAHRSGAKVALIGDHRQLQPIDAGGAFRALEERLQSTKLIDIRRQRQPWAQRAVHQFASGRALEALAAYHQRGLLSIEGTKDEAIAAMTRAWLSLRNDHPDQSVLMLASTRQENEQLNQSVRDKLKSAGQLQTSIPVSTDQGRREFSLGDRILFSRNSTLYGVKNGTLGTLERISERGPLGTVFHVRLDDGRLSSFNPKHYSAIDHGYALTTHKAQGVTVDQTLILAGGPMTDRELSYVQMSRHRDTAKLFVDRETLDELLIEALPTESMVNYADAVAKQNQVKPPQGYDSSFLLCREFLNEHGHRQIEVEQTASQEIYALAKTMNISRQKDTTLDYMESDQSQRGAQLER